MTRWSRALALVFLAGCGGGSPAPAQADFGDPGFFVGHVRSEYAPGVGASFDKRINIQYTNPETLDPCLHSVSLFSNRFFGCPGAMVSIQKPDGNPGWFGLQARPYCNGSSFQAGVAPLGCVVYDSSPYFSINTPSHSNGNYWIAGANSEPSFEQCNSGPPNLSEPIIDFLKGGLGLYNISTEQMAFGKRLHMRISADAHSFFCNKLGVFTYKIPYMSVGTTQGFSQTQPVAIINGTPLANSQNVSWRHVTQMYVAPGCKDPTGPGNVACLVAPPRGGANAGLFVVAEWGGKRRAIQVTLLNQGLLSEPPVPYAPGVGFWNWPISQSSYFPGAEIGYMAVNYMADACLNRAGQPLVVPSMRIDSTAPINYDVDIGAIFKCASDKGLFSDPMPATNVEVKTINWFMEIVGTKGTVWHSVENPRINWRF